MKIMKKKKYWTNLVISPDIVICFRDDYNFSDKSLLTNAQASKLHKASVNGSSTIIKLLETQ